MTENGLNIEGLAVVGGKLYERQGSHVQASAGHQPEVCCREFHEETLARDARRFQSEDRLSQLVGVQGYRLARYDGADGGRAKQVKSSRPPLVIPPFVIAAQDGASGT
jgi:hypothetical protein